MNTHHVSRVSIQLHAHTLHLQRERVGLREGAEAHERLRNGDAGGGHKFAQLRAGIQAAAAHIQHRPLRAVDCVHNRLDVLRTKSQLNFWILEEKNTSMMRSMLLQPSLEHAVEHIKKDADYYDDFRRGAKRVYWRMGTV